MTAVCHQKPQYPSFLHDNAMPEYPSSGSPSSPSISWLSSNSFNISPTETRTGHQVQQCSQNRPSNPAKEAVVSMGFPEQLVQLAIDIRLLDHGTSFSSVQELYLAAEYLCENLEKQADGYKRLYEHAHLKQVRDVPSPVSSPKEALAAKPIYLDPKEATLLEKPEALEKPPLKGQLPEESVQVGSARLSAGMSKDAVTAASGKRPQIENVKALAQENKRLKERKVCRACRKVELANSGITFLPCGHFITCETCSEMFDDCPACGKNIMGTVRTFLS